MKLKILIAAMLVAVCAHAQNLTSVTAANIVDATNTKIPSGTLCFIGTDASDNPIGYQIGGGGQVVLTPACTPITNGAISGFSVANPALTSPANIAYRITVSDSHTLVRTDKLVQFTGASFNYDTYVPPIGTITLGVSVPVLSVGNITVSGTCTGCSSGGSGITTLNTLNGTTQTFAVGTSGSNFAINSTGTVHTFNLPNASTSNRGALTSSDWNLFNGKQAAIAGNNCAARNFGNGINTAGTLLCGQPNSTQLADFSATAPSTAGKIPIYDPAATNSAGGTGAYVPGDPLVQGLVADGSTTAENPVAIGAYDTAGTPALHRAIALNGTPAGTEYGIVTRPIPSGTQTISGAVTNSNLDVALSTRLKPADTLAGVTTVGAVTAITNALPAGSNVIGHVIHDTGSTTAVTGNVTVVQPTGTNLHAVVDSAPTTAVTNAGLTNLDVALSTRLKPADTLAAVTSITNPVAITAASLPVPASVTATGNITNTQAIQVSTSGAQTVVMNVSGTWTGTIQPQLSVDGTTFGSVGVIPFAPTGASVSTITANGNYFIVVGGASKFQLLGATVASGTAVITEAASPAGFAQLAIQSTAANLNATVVQATGTNLHSVIDTGSTTAVTQATGTNLHAVLDANSGVDIGKLTANQSTNVAQVAGTTADVNSGTKSNGTLRVVLATDQPALTNKLLVTPDSVALPANQSVNVSQINAVTPLMGNGITGTGSQRVTIASDNTAFAVNNTQQGTASQNVAQVNGVATSTGTGVMGTGVQRVAIASDNDPVTVKQATAANLNATVVGTGTFVTQSTLAAETTKVVGTVRVVGNVGGVLDVANNSAAPANLAAIGFETATQGTTQPTKSTAGNMRFGLARTDGAIYVAPHGPVIWSCGLSAIGTTLTQCQAAPGAGLSLYITDVVAQSNTTTSGLFTLRFGTGSNCGTGTGNIFFASASALIAAPASTSPVNDFHFTVPIQVTAANALCVLGVATNTTNIQVNGYTAP